MNGNNAILDSNIIIFASKKKIDVEKLLSRYDSFYVSIITYVEVYAFNFQDSSEKMRLIESLPISKLLKSI